MKLSKVYQPSEFENDIYALWEKSEAFTPKNRGNKETFSIVMPPPNANANLHVGYALTNAVLDISTRYNRMLGKASILLPGADHAGFDTWVVYEKKLNAEGKTRFDYSREELYSQVWDFVKLNKESFESQIRAMGASCDWSRYTFTLDEKIVKTAYQTFKKMWDEKLIYRGERLVNYCTYHGTSFSDIEVTYKEVKGHLWSVEYPLTDGSGSITVATTRPETMLGDTAVAVNPKDARYKQYLGKTVKLPLTNREIPIIADAMVDKSFGSGAVKITPAHDPNDFEVAQRHDLPMITVIDHEGNMTHDVPEPYKGLSVDEARKKVIEDLKSQELLLKEADYSHSVGHCYKCETVIQPLLRDQWFIDMKPLTRKAISTLRSEEINFQPKAKLNQSIEYLKNIRDWNISRQIAWGIPIPAFQNVENPEDWIFDERVEQETVAVKGKTYRRDPDVFDTWFSSGSWPYATLDFPDGEDYKKYYPLSVMGTGFDILNQWVLRMIMLGTYVAGKVPFKDVYLHGLVVDEKGRKMSKSKGNVVNPMDVIEKFGSDALRMGIISGQSAGNNQPYNETKVIAGRNLCNKLWNIARYTEDKVGDNFNIGNESDAKTAADHWILARFALGIEKISSDLDEYRFNEAYEAMYHLLWNDFADWYIEASKTQTNLGFLAYVLEMMLKLAHPFAPFVTETIWQTLNPDSDNLLIISPWPKSPKYDSKRAGEFEEIKKLVSEIRHINATLNLHKLTLYHTDVAFLTKNAVIIKTLARLENVASVKDGYGLHLTQTKYKCWLDVNQQSANEYCEKLKDKIDSQNQLIKQLKGRLANKPYLSNAPKELIAQTKKQLSDAEELLGKISSEYDRFSRVN